MSKVRFQTNLLGRWATLSDDYEYHPNWSEMVGEKLEIVGAFQDDERSAWLMLRRPSGEVVEIPATSVTVVDGTEEQRLLTVLHAAIVDTPALDSSDEWTALAVEIRKLLERKEVEEA